MTTTNTPAGKRKPLPRVDPDPVPMRLRWIRTLFTLLSIPLMLGGTFLLAMAYAAEASVLWPCVIIGVGAAMAFLSQQTDLYVSADNRRTRRRAERAERKKARAEAKKNPVPQQRTPAPGDEVTEVVRVPNQEPAETLGDEFHFIVMTTRNLFAAGRQDVLDVLDEWWDRTDWEAPPRPDDAYRKAVDMVYEIADRHPAYNDDVDQRGLAEDLLAGTADTGNAFPFVYELDHYSPAAGALATAMLVRRQLDPATFDLILTPWTEGARLPFRLEQYRFEADPNGSYHPVPVQPPAAPTLPGTRRGRPARTASTPVDLREALADAAEEREAEQPKPAAPGAAEPAVEPAPPVRAEDPTDDVPAPTLDDLLLAAEMVIVSQQGSRPMLQRKMRIGFVPATRILHELEVNYGVVGRRPADDSAREVIPDVEELGDQLSFIREEYDRRHPTPGS